MPKYIINNNQQNTGEHEVHNETSNCTHLPHPSNRINLGFHANCHYAVAQAKRLYPGKKIDGCFYCANECHTR